MLNFIAKHSQIYKDLVNRLHEYKLRMEEVNTTVRELQSQLMNYKIKCDLLERSQEKRKIEEYQRKPVSGNRKF